MLIGHVVVGEDPRIAQHSIIACFRKQYDTPDVDVTATDTTYVITYSVFFMTQDIIIQTAWGNQTGDRVEVMSITLAPLVAFRMTWTGRTNGADHMCAA